MSPAQSFTRNLLLSRLDPADFELLQSDLERIELTRGQDLVRAGVPIEFVHFPEGGIVSVVAETGESAIEVGLVGREGLVGAAVLLGADRCSDRSFVQIDMATALRIAPARLIEAIGSSERLRLVLLRFVQVLSVQAARTAVSNALNELPQRLARWLLMCHDRVDLDAMPLTHEFMAMMLGVRRSGVTVALHLLEGMDAIDSRRGAIGIRDRARLETIAGDAYGVPEVEYRRLLGPFGKSAPAG
jgi:CRP-like cAMP-binding protein